MTKARKGGKKTARRRGEKALPAAVERIDPWKEALGFLGQLAGFVDRDGIAKLRREIAARMRRIPTRMNAYGYDPWGLNRDFASQLMLASGLVYRNYFRVETHGIEHLPKGRMLLIGNHAGQVALDAAMIATACFLEAEPPRIIRGMGEYWLPTVPFVNLLMVRSGSVVGTPKNCTDLLHNEEAVIAFPEGVRGM